MDDNNRSDASLVKAGPTPTYLSETQYYKVLDNTGLGGIRVRNERGKEFTIGNGIIAEGSYTNDQFTEEQLVSRTELIDIFNNVGSHVFTVTFNKQPKAKDINKALESLNKGKILSNKEIKATIKKVYEGTERTLVGYLLKTETGFGRSMVIDLEVEPHPDNEVRIRQVDHRTISELIYKNVRYYVK